MFEQFSSTTDSNLILRGVICFLLRYVISKHVRNNKWWMKVSYESTNKENEEESVVDLVATKSYWTYIWLALPNQVAKSRALLTDPSKYTHTSSARSNLDSNSDLLGLQPDKSATRTMSGTHSSLGSLLSRVNVTPLVSGALYSVQDNGFTASILSPL